jgi:hypothetical protein
MRRLASFVNCFLQNWSIDTFKHKTDKYSVHFQEMPGFKGKRKGGLTLTCIVYCCIWSVTLAKSIVPRKTWPKLWHSYISKLFLTKMQVKFSIFFHCGSKKANFNFWHVHTLRSVFVNSPPPKPEVILTNFFAEPTVTKDYTIGICCFPAKALGIN